MLSRELRTQIIGLAVLVVISIAVSALTTHVLAEQLRLAKLPAEQTAIMIERAASAVRLLTAFILSAVLVTWLLAVVLPARAAVSRFRTQIKSYLSGGVTGKINDPLAQLLADALSELETARRQLLASERISALGFFAGGIAHQIGNPLSAARQYVEVLRLQAGPKNDELLPRLQQQLDRIHTAVEGLSRLARPERLTSETVSADALLADVLEQVRSTWPGHLEVTLSGELAALVVTDRLAVGQALLNYIRNAAEAQGQGHVRLNIAVSRLGDFVRFEISDFGPGFAPGFRPDAVFESEKLGGTGLGIPLATRLIDLVGGAVKFENWKEGAKVTVSLPAAGQRTKSVS